ncbi:MAG TPA: universal stress protein [Flavitalea sp.]|nr:universal stress protein [Flavitalea sp.]
MKKILVPTDFSETSKNAARYAINLARSIPGSSVVLYHLSDKIALGSDSSPVTETEDDRKLIVGAALENMKDDLDASDVQIQNIAEGGSSLVECLSRYVRHKGMDLIVMGITGATRLEQIFMGSNALDMVKENVCPVIIVPPNSTFKQIKNVLFTSDFKNVESTTPIASIKKLLDAFRPTLHIINVDHEHYVEVTDEYKVQRQRLEEMLQDYNPQFYFMRLYDFVEAVSVFAADHNIDLIVTVPRRHSFLAGFYKTSHTKKLAYHSHIPIAAVQE